MGSDPFNDDEDSDSALSEHRRGTEDTRIIAVRAYDKAKAALRSINAITDKIDRMQADINEGMHDQTKLLTRVATNQEASMRDIKACKDNDAILFAKMSRMQSKALWTIIGVITALFTTVAGHWLVLSLFGGGQ